MAAYTPFSDEGYLTNPTSVPVFFPLSPDDKHRCCYGYERKKKDGGRFTESSSLLPNPRLIENRWEIDLERRKMRIRKREQVNSINRIRSGREI
jgi:hypothetical protein